ncbi:MAG TPA: SDR family NAD(P)-dependent oxidoreductase [Anaerolineales bacterium]|nr:SDR family NAD(P)-dependent oxidoreductase [Anaerolineales bacterium]
MVLEKICSNIALSFFLQVQEDRLDIKGKVVIVTGASSGIGEVAVRQFAQEGAKVVLAARRVDRLETLAREISAMGTSAETLVVQADLSKLEDIRGLIDQTLQRFGRIDVLANNPRTR